MTQSVVANMGTFTVSVNGVRTPAGEIKVQVVAPIEADGLLLSVEEALRLADLIQKCAERLAAEYD